MDIKKLTLDNLSKAEIHYGLSTPKGKMQSRDVTILIEHESPITCKMKDLLSHVEDLSKRTTDDDPDLKTVTNKLSHALSEGNQSVINNELTKFQAFKLRFKQLLTPDHAKRIEKLAMKFLPIVEKSLNPEEENKLLKDLGFEELIKDHKNVHKYYIKYKLRSIKGAEQSIINVQDRINNTDFTPLLNALNKNDIVAHRLLRSLHEIDPLLVVIALDKYDDKNNDFLLERELAERALKLPPKIAENKPTRSTQLFMKNFQETLLDKKDVMKEIKKNHKIIKDNPVVDQMADNSKFMNALKTMFTILGDKTLFKGIEDPKQVRIIISWLINQDPIVAKYVITHIPASMLKNTEENKLLIADLEAFEKISDKL